MICNINFTNLIHKLFNMNRFSSFMDVKNQINESIETKKKLLELSQDIEDAGKIIIDALQNGNKILICGNGGSAADSQHFAAELAGRFEKERKPLAGIALTTDSSNLTAIGNDYGFDTVFSRQISAIGRSGDVLVAISTSGNSKNILLAVENALSIGMKVVGLSGRDGGVMKNLPIKNVIVSSQKTSRIQECHILIIHIWCGMVDEKY